MTKRRHRSRSKRKSGAVVHTFIRSSSSVQNLQSKSFQSLNRLSSTSGIGSRDRSRQQEKNSSTLSIKESRSGVPPCDCTWQNRCDQSLDSPDQTDPEQNKRQERPESQRHERKRRSPKSAYGKCCICSPLCTAVSILGGLLVGIAVAALLVALLTRSQTTTTSVTRLNTSTTSTTSSTSVTTTTSITTSTTTSITTSTTSVTTTTTSVTTTTVTTTTTTTTFLLSLGSSDPLVGLWNTTAGGNSVSATPGWGPGNYVPAEPALAAFDQSCGTKYTSFGPCTFPTPVTPFCGLNTGFQVTPLIGPTIIRGFRICTGNDFPERDPMTMTLEGSNQTGSALFLGSSWRLIYNGSTGLATDPGRQQYGVRITFSNNIPYRSYRLLMPLKRANDVALQYSEIELTS